MSSTTVRQQVAERDGNRCRWCGSNQGLHQHHIIYKSHGGPTEVDNLIVLCHQCHARAHSDKRRYAPLLLAYIDFNRRGLCLSIPQVERWLGQEEPADQAS